MIWLVALVSLAVGIVIGCRLRGVLALWRSFRYRQTFRPTMLQPCHPARDMKSMDGQR